MSRLNLHRNLFLEREELLRFQKFMLESPVNKVFIGNTVNFGIIDTSGGVGDPVDFKLEAGTNAGTIKIANPSIAFDSDGLLIQQPAVDNIAVAADGNWHWYYIEHVYSILEEGTISINSSGIVTGTGTKFLEILRGQSTEVPVKVKLISSNNTGVYEVVEVVDDLNMTLQSETFVAESGLQYYVIGSTPLGETVTNEQKEGLYYYDSCHLVHVTGTADNGVSPLTLTAGKQFFLGIALNTAGTVTVIDGRDNDYWEYYIRGVSDKLDKNNNLSDVLDAGVARANLGGLMTQAEIEALLNVDETSWLTMTAGSKIKANSIFKIKRKGNLVTVTGSFMVDTDENLANDDVIAQIAYNSIGANAAPAVDIYFQAALLESNNGGKTHGFMGIIEKWVDQGILFIRYKEPGGYMVADSFDKLLQFTVTYIGG